MILRIILLSFLFSCANDNLFAQVAAISIDEPLNVGVMQSCSDAPGNIYILHEVKQIGYKIADLHFKKWNGLFWIDLPVLQTYDYVHSTNNALAMYFYKGNLHVAGSFKSNDGIIGIAAFNGEKWVSVGSIHSNYLIHDEISINHLIEFKGDLYATGEFNLADGKLVKNFAKFTSGNWTGIDINGGSISGITVIGDSLFIAGSFANVEGVTVKNVAKFSSGSWFPVTNSFTSIKGLTSVKNELIVVEPSGIYKRSGQTWQLFNATPIQVINVFSYVELNGRLYISGNFTTSLGKPLRIMVTTPDSTSFLLFDDDFRFTGNREVFLQRGANKELYILGSFNKLQKQNFRNIAVFKPGFTAISGLVYIDHNENCMFDNTDEALKNVLVSLNNGQYYTSTDANGYYQIFVETAKVNSFKVIYNEGVTAICKGSEQYLSSASLDQNTHIDFAFKLNPSIPSTLDFWSTTGYVVKHGFEGKYIIEVDGNASTSKPIKLSLQRDARLKEFTSSVNYRYAKDGLITWELTEKKRIELTFKIDPATIQMNDTLHFEANISEPSSKFFKEQKFNQTVVSAFDPNDKQCNAREIELGTSRLNYHIRFQNLGNAEATDVRIVDTIGNNASIESIQILDNSHFTKYATAYKVRDHAIIWSFKDINLGAKQIVGEEASSGFVSYKNGLSNNMFVGQIFTNRAFIYFDFQPPIETNTTITTVIESKEKDVHQVNEIKIYPNPAKDFCHVVSPIQTIVAIDLYAIDGKLVQSYAPENPANHVLMPIHKVQMGIYYVRIQHHLGYEVYPIVVMP